MKIIIVGIGKLGEYLTKNLVRDGNEVTIIDTDFTTSMDVINNEDVNYVLANCKRTFSFVVFCKFAD